MRVEVFLGCRPRREYDFQEREYKGIHFSTETHLFYVFINNYYLKGKFDMLSNNFRIDREEQALNTSKTIVFKDSHPEFERRSIKYIKQARCKTYITVNPSETYSFEFENGEKNGEGQVIARKLEGKFVHLCPNQILEISRFLFCFESSVSHRSEVNSIKISTNSPFFPVFRSTILHQRTISKLTKSRLCIQFRTCLKMLILISLFHHPTRD